MATLFGTDATSLSEPRGAGAQPLSGVATPASQVSLPTGLMNVGVQVYSDLQERKQEQLKQAAKQQQTNLLSTYSRTKTNIANSNLPLQEKTARMNAIDSQFMLAATEMGIMDDFKKARDLLNTGGITGDVVSQEEAIRKDQEDKVNFLRTNNVFVPRGTDPAIVDSLIDLHSKNEQILKSYEVSQKQLADSQKNLLFTQGQEQRAIEASATKTINEFAGTSIQSFNIQAKIISDRVLAREITEGQARADLLELQTNFLGPLNALSVHNESLGNSWRDMYEGVVKAHMDIITNRGEEGGRDIQRILNTAALASGQDNPDLVNIASLKPWIGENTLTQVIVTEQLAARLLPTLISRDFSTDGVKGNNIVGNSDNKTSEVTTYSFIRQGIRDVRGGTSSNPEEAKADYFLATNNILSMLGDKNPGSLEAADLIDVTDFMLSPEFAYVVKENGLNASAAAAAQNVFNQVYKQNMDGVIKKFLTSPAPNRVSEGVREDRAYLDLLDIKFQDGRVQLIPKPLTAETVADARVVGQVIRRSVKDLEKALNQNMRIGAHLEGTTDYQKFWEDNKDILMPYVFSDPETDIPNQHYNGTEYEYIGPVGGNTSDQRNWRPVNGGTN